MQTLVFLLSITPMPGPLSLGLTSSHLWVILALRYPGTPLEMSRPSGGGRRVNQGWKHLVSALRPLLSKGAGPAFGKALRRLTGQGREPMPFNGHTDTCKMVVCWGLRGARC